MLAHCDDMPLYFGIPLAMVLILIVVTLATFIFCMWTGRL